MNRQTGLLAFVVGLLAIGWVGAGYVGHNLLAFSMTLLIAAFYVMAALELWRFSQATGGLVRALGDIPEPLPGLGDWLARLHPSLQNPVRLRIEGERVALPGPAMTPFIVGLLVLLGMLGTFLGMVVTLKGAVLALESTTDLATIRAALAAPVKGLGLAFGTSVAGVAASAMLGLVSALCRRERLQAAQLLDSAIATRLRVFTLAHQREESLRTLQQQAAVMPTVVDHLQTLMAQMAQQGQALNDRLLASQQGFHQEAKSVYTELAASVGHALSHSLTESARLAGATIQPVVEATMAGITRETAVLHARMADTAQGQLEGLSARLASAASSVTDTLASAEQQRLQAFTSQLTLMAATLRQEWQQAGTQTLGQQQAICETLAHTAAQIHSRAEDQTSRTLAEIAGLVQAAGEAPRAAAEVIAQLQQVSRDTAQLHERMGHTVQAQLDGLSEQFGRSTTAVTATLAATEQQRLGAFTLQLQALAAALREEWQQASALTLGQQQAICETLEHTARDIHTQAQAQASQTITEVAGLMQTAAEAPRVAAEVMAQLRQQLSDSMARDNSLLDERSRIMGTLGSLLDTIKLAATEQRGAIDALVASSAELMQRASTQFSAQIEAESGKLGSVAAQITGSAVEVASLGEAFGLGVQLFSDSSRDMVSQLQRIEAALAKSATRSDEQLAYYVAQAREVIDLSISSQRQIVDDLQQLAAARPAAAAAVASELS